MQCAFRLWVLMSAVDRHQSRALLLRNFGKFLRFPAFRTGNAWHRQCANADDAWPPEPMMKDWSLECSFFPERVSGYTFQLDVQSKSSST